MNKIKEKNVAKLPIFCYGVLSSDNSIIKMKVGENGYYPQQGFKKLNREEADHMANFLNDEIGVTIQQRMAMEFGSMFLWNSSLANPDSYNENGVPKKDI